MNRNRRKKLRIGDYDYSSNGAYFVTVCTHERAELFGSVGEKTEASAMIERTFEETLLDTRKCSVLNMW